MSDHWGCIDAAGLLLVRVIGDPSSCADGVISLSLLVSPLRSEVHGGDVDVGDVVIDGDIEGSPLASLELVDLLSFVLPLVLIQERLLFVVKRARAFLIGLIILAQIVSEGHFILAIGGYLCFLDS